MEESVTYCIDGQTLFVSDEQFKTLSLNSDCGFVSVPSEQSQVESSTSVDPGKNVLPASSQNMQESFANSTSVYNSFVVSGVDVLPTQPGILVNTTSLVQSPFTNNYMITSSSRESDNPANSDIKSGVTSSAIRLLPPDTLRLKAKTTALHIRLQTGADGFFTQLNITGAMSQDLDINTIVTEAIAQVYNIDADLEALVVDEGIVGENCGLLAIDEKHDNCLEVATTSKQVMEKEKLLAETTNLVIETGKQSSRKSGKAFEEPVNKKAVQDGIPVEELTGETDGPAEQKLNSKVVVCGVCNYVSRGSIICPRCRRKLSHPTRSTSESKEPMSSESESSPNKTEKEHRSHETKRRRCTRKSKKEDRKKVEEPPKYEEPATVSLLSSDEEEEANKSLQNGSHPLTDIFSREPVITADTEPVHDSLRGGGLELESLLDSPEIEKIRLDCYSVRFGSYKVQPQDKIILTEHGVRLKVPSISKAPTIIKILMKDIVKVLIHFGKSGQFQSMAAPTFFYYITHDASKKIREALHMSLKNKDVYFDPTSKEEQHKRITLLPETVSIQDRLFIKSIYESRCLMEELTWNEANDILVRAAPKDVQHNLNKDPSSVKHLNSQTPADNIQQIMIYPPPPCKGGISINTEDYGCLKEDQFLNDVIIDFYLKYLWINVFTEEEKRRTHIFSSFFYKRLTMMPPRNNNQVARDNTPRDNIPAAEKRHARVKGWTKSVDIFDKDFIIIPINERSHWFLGIICFPGLNGPVRMSDNTPVPDLSKKKGDASVLAGGQVPAKIWGTTISLVKPSNERPTRQSKSSTINVEPDEEKGEESERDEAEADSDEMEPATTDEESNKEDDLLDEATPRISKVKPNLEAIKQPCILIFDSLAMQSRAKVVATLREYLQVEWKIRHKGKPKDFSKDVFKGAVPKVPQQPNFVDCGLYLLQFVEAFFKNPITDYRMPIRSIKDWFTNDVVSRKRFNIMKLLHALMREQNIDTSQLNLPHLDLNPYEFEDGDEDEEDGLGEEGIEFGEEAVEEEEAMEEEDEEEDEDGEVDPYGPLETPIKEAKRFDRSTRSVDIQRSLEVARAMEMSQVEMGRSVEMRHDKGEPSQRRFNSPSPRGEMSIRPEVRAEPVRSEPSPRARLPDSVTICEANSKRKLPLSLKDIRNTRLSSPQASLEKIKKARVD